MADENDQDPKSGPLNQDEIDKRIDDFKRVVSLSNVFANWWMPGVLKIGGWHAI